MEPLTTIGALERYLLKMVARQWYDHERMTFNFVKKLKEPSFSGITFTHQRDFDENGVIYWIGTNAKWVLYFKAFHSVAVCLLRGDEFSLQDSVRMGQPCSVWTRGGDIIGRQEPALWETGRYPQQRFFCTQLSH